MTKDLEALYTPLQSLNNIRYNYFDKKSGSELDYFWFNRVETTLKDYESLVIKRNQEFQQLTFRYESDQRKLRALDIIKEKCLKIDFKVLLASPDYESYCFTLNSTKYLTQEEYDLLKEVLL